MSYEIDVKKEDLLSVIDDKSLSEALKPLVREIYLFDTFIAGTSYIEDPSILDQLQINERLKLVREESKFDDLAILIQNSEGKKLGYVPRKDNVIFSRLMDAGKLLIGKVKEKDQIGSFSRIRISIYLIDY